MLKAMVFLLKAGFVVALAVWVAERPGSVRIEWQDYTVTAHTGVFLLALLGTVLLAIFLYNLIAAIAGLPGVLRRYRDRRDRDRAYRSLTLGLAAVAAGDTKLARYHAYRVRRLAPRDNGLPLLLSAQAARLDGREDEARDHFVALLENKDAAFLGVRGLLQAAMDMGHYDKALQLARQALTLHPKQPWILRTVYDLEIRQQDWPGARKTLPRTLKSGAIEADTACADLCALLLAEADQIARDDRRAGALELVKKAHAADPAFVPAVTRLAKLQNMEGKRRAAIRTIERAWKSAPHPDYIAVWDILAPRGKPGKNIGRMQWVEKLLEIDADCGGALVVAARIAMEQQLWGEARSYLRRAESLEPSDAVYRALADLEIRCGNGEEAALGWHEKAAAAPPAKSWICTKSARVYEQWQPVSQPQGYFNTIRWESPGGVLEELAGSRDPLLLAPGA